MNSVVLDGVIPGPRLGNLEGETSGSSVLTPVPLRGTSPPSVLRRILSFAGPGYMVAVGYMDPGNWATSLSAGSGFGYSLLSVILLADRKSTRLNSSHFQVSRMPSSA